MTRRFCEHVSSKYNWESCTIDFSHISFRRAFLLFREYGTLISTLRLRGPVSACTLESLFYVVTKYCPHVCYVDSFSLPYLIPVTDGVFAFSLSFPSTLSVFLTKSIANERNVVYSAGDCIVQCMDLHGHALEGFTQSIWQFEIENGLQTGYSVTFECRINDYVVGEFTLQDSSVASTYAINMLYPIPKCAAGANHHCLTLSLVCTTHLPFGAGFVRVSSLGRVSLLKSRDLTSVIDPSVPAYVAPAF